MISATQACRCRMWLVAILAALKPLVASSADDPVCPSPEPEITHRLRLDFKPSYFAKVFPRSDFVSLIAGDRNWLINLKTGKQKQVWGSYDPVPTPDEAFLTSMNKEQGLRIFLMSDIMNKPSEDDHFPESWRSNNFNTAYAYESLGALPSEMLNRNYRLLVDDDKGDFYIRDFHFVFKNREDDVPKLTEDGWNKVCKNKNILLKLPMISKDGTQLSAYDVNRQRTVIFKIDDQGNCEEREVLPFQTGKGDFSFDGRFVAFHVEKGQMDPQWFQFADIKRKMDVYVWDLEKHEATKVTHQGAGGNSYFPTFRQDGTIGFLQQSANANGKIAFSYVLADPKVTRLKADPTVPLCYTNSFAYKAGLGLLWAQACNLKAGLALADAALIPSAFTPDTCKNMVSKNYQLLPSVIKRLSTGGANSIEKKLATALKNFPKEALLAACGRNFKADEIVKSSGVIKDPKTPAEKLKVSCTECHAGANPAGNFAINTAEIFKMPKIVREKMAGRVLRGEMPPGGFPATDRKAISDYLMSR